MAAGPLSDVVDLVVDYEPLVVMQVVIRISSQLKVGMGASCLVASWPWSPPFPTLPADWDPLCIVSSLHWFPFLNEFILSCCSPCPIFFENKRGNFIVKKRKSLINAIAVSFLFFFICDQLHDNYNTILHQLSFRSSCLHAQSLFYSVPITQQPYNVEVSIYSAPAILNSLLPDTGA